MDEDVFEPFPGVPDYEIFERNCLADDDFTFDDSDLDGFDPEDSELDTEPEDYPDDDYYDDYLERYRFDVEEGY